MEGERQPNRRDKSKYCKSILFLICTVSANSLHSDIDEDEW